MPFCQVCLELDFGVISETGVDLQYSIAEGYPGGLGLFFYSPISEGDPAPQKYALIPYHKSLQSLRDGAKTCELCRMALGSVEAVLQSMEEAVRRDYGYNLDGYELFLAGRLRADGFVIVGHTKNVRKGHQPQGRTETWILGSVGFCADEGKNTGCTQFQVFKISFLTFNCCRKSAGLNHKW